MRVKSAEAPVVMLFAMDWPDWMARVTGAWLACVMVDMAMSQPRKLCGSRGIIRFVELPRLVVVLLLWLEALVMSKGGVLSLLVDGR